MNITFRTLHETDPTYQPDILQWSQSLTHYSQPQIPSREPSKDQELLIPSCSLGNVLSLLLPLLLIVLLYPHINSPGKLFPDNLVYRRHLFLTIPSLFLVWFLYHQLSNIGHVYILFYPTKT